MKDKKEISDIKFSKALIKREKKKKNTDEETVKRIEELIRDIPPRYKDIFKEELGNRKPSRRDVDIFLRKHKLIKKP